ncbi:MAG: transketolase [Ilumatobacteraceae bacterium]
MPATLDPSLDRAAVNLIRGFAMDAPFAANSGHQGTAMSLAPVAHVLFSRIMNFDPADTEWVNRDRFVLSNGHASILQYSLLYLTGSGLELDDIKAFRQWGSKTPGHPEAGHTAGVEVTTGPLGQGVANAVGMAIAEAHLRDRFGRDLMDHHTFVLLGDGCMMEGISHEAASLAGHLGLGHLVAIYDDNKITIDGATNLAYGDDAGSRFEAYGWHVERVGAIAEDLDALEAAIRRAMAVEDRPSLIVLETQIGFPSPEFTGKHEAHANPLGAEEIGRTKAVMGIPDEPFWAPAEIVDAYRSHAALRGGEAHSAWTAAAEQSSARAEFDACWSAPAPGWDAALPSFEAGKKIATRAAVQDAFKAVLDTVPALVAGAADLTGNTGVKLDADHPITPDDAAGRQIYYGIREHAMGSAMVGMARHGGLVPAGGTFFVFFDYMKPSVRLAALSKAKVVFVFTHDSVGVGEDGPTHQPVEQLAALRSIPDLQVIRPADANETSAAVRAAIEHHGPTALVLTRQGVPVCTDGSAVATGAGVLRAEDAPDVVLIGAGSEVHLCVAAADRLAESGVAAQVVSLPSWDRFEAQPEEFRSSVLPAGVPTLTVEAGSTFGWHKYGDDCIGIDRFGASAPGDVVLDRLGINVDHIVERATALVSAGKD